MPQCLQPIIEKQDLMTKTKYQLKLLQDHPLFGVLVWWYALTPVLKAPGCIATANIY